MPVGETISKCAFSELGFELVCRIFGRTATFEVEAVSKVRNYGLTICAFHVATGFNVRRIYSSDGYRLGELQSDEFKLNILQLIIKGREKLK